MTTFHVRLGSTNRQADSELIAELQRVTSGVSFDEQPLVDCSSEVIDLQAAAQAFSTIRTISERDLENLRVLVRYDHHLVPTVGGFLLFGRERERLFPDAWVQCGRFIGLTKTQILDHIEIHDYLPMTVERIMDFLKKHALRGADLSQIRRRDIWSIPLVILREAVINALVHTDYSQKGAPIRISFFDDRIEVENPGILLPGLTIEDIMQGVSRLRNRVIGRTFRELGLIEQWGSGILRMVDEAKKLGLPIPVIEELGLRYRLTVFLHSDQLNTINDGKTPEESVTKLASGTKLALSRRQLEILETCRQPKTFKELLQLSGRSDGTKFRNQVVNPLLKEELIEMTVPNKPKSKNQHYQLTEKGKTFMLYDQRRPQDLYSQQLHAQR